MFLMMIKRARVNNQMMRVKILMKNHIIKVQKLMKKTKKIQINQVFMNKKLKKKNKKKKFFKIMIFLSKITL